MELYDVFLKGLSTNIQEMLIPLYLPPDLDSLIALAIRTDNHMQELKQGRGNRLPEERSPRAPKPSWPEPRSLLPEPSPFPPSGGDTEPMQLGLARLNPEERRRRLLKGRAFTGSSHRFMSDQETQARGRAHHVGSPLTSAHLSQGNTPRHHN